MSGWLHLKLHPTGWIQQLVDFRCFQKTKGKKFLRIESICTDYHFYLQAWLGSVRDASLHPSFLIANFTKLLLKSSIYINLKLLACSIESMDHSVRDIAYSAHTPGDPVDRRETVYWKIGIAFDWS